MAASSRTSTDVEKPSPKLVAKLQHEFPGLTLKQANEIARRIQGIVLDGRGRGRAFAVGDVLPDGGFGLDIYTLESIVSDEMRKRPRR